MLLCVYRTSRKLLIYGSIGLLLIGYLVLSVSAVKYDIGRRSPFIAALLSPPTFNFLGRYREGRVRGFEMGMSREELAATIVAEYSGRGHLVADCQISTARSLVPIGDGPELLELLSTSEVFCVHGDPVSFGMRFVVSRNFLEEIEVWYVNFEGP